MRSRFARPCALLLFVLVAACGPGGRIHEGDDLLAQNKFDAALLAYQRAYLGSPDHPRAKEALGRMLTLRRVSFYAGLDLMKSAYDQKPSPALRRDLVLLHTEAGDLERAESLLHPDHMALDEYMTEAASVERAFVTCMRKQNEEGFYALSNRPADSVQTKESFQVRCLLSPGWRRTKLDDAKKIFAAIQTPRTQCELLTLFPELSDQKSADCRAKFPGVIAIYRESIKGIEAEKGRTPKLFEDELFIPGEPPPQPKEEEAGPFVATPPNATAPNPGTALPPAPAP